MDEWSDVFSAQVENARWSFIANPIESMVFISALHIYWDHRCDLANLPTTLDPIQRTYNLHVRWLALALVSLAAASLATGALFSLLTIAIRKTLNVGVKGMQHTWVEWSK